MKNSGVFLIFVLALFARFAQAQEIHQGWSFELGNVLNGSQSYEYRANDFIHLKKGFLSVPQSPNYALMEIDPYFNPEMPYDTLYWQPADCTVPGRLGFYPMSFDVNENGAAVITMPLEFPEGVNGMTPHLSLNYNSQGGNGILGLGWSLGGMSKISRVPYTYMYDDSCHAVQFSNADELSLDGVVLRKGSKNGVVCYYPEIYDYSIVYPINSNGSIDNGFRVLKKDGTVCTYNAKYYLQSQLNTPIEWHLSRVEDPFGNYIEYVYGNDQGEGAFYPTLIRYTGHDGLSSKYEIRFEYYEDERNDCPPKYFSRPDSQNNYVGHSRIAKKLWSIQCWYENHKTIQYSLSYNTLDWNIRALSQVKKTCFDSNGAKRSYNTLIPTEFQWKGTDYQLHYETAADSIGLNAYLGNNIIGWHQHTAFAARFEHNKIVSQGVGPQKFEHDIVLLLKEDEKGIRYRLNVIRSSNTVGQVGQAYDYESQNYDCQDVSGDLSNGRAILAFMPADTDGDGLNEIVCVSYYSGEYRVRISLLMPDEHGVFSERECKMLSCTNSNSLTDFQIADFNGDGLSDMFCMNEGKPMALMSKVGNPFIADITHDVSYGVLNRRIVLGDFNGDKKDQIVIIGRQTSGNNTRYADYLRINETTGGFQFSDCHSINSDISDIYYGTSPCYRLCSGDFNGDGKTDMVLHCDSAWHFYYSQGNGSFYAYENPYYEDGIVNDSIIRIMEGNENLPTFAVVADFDNDGCDDIGILWVKRFMRPSPDVPNNSISYCGVFRKDFLIRPTQNAARVRKIENLRSWYENGQQRFADVCIDSIKESVTITNPFLPVIGNHKGTSPTEIMCCGINILAGSSRYKARLHNTGCLDNPPVRAINRIITSLGTTTKIEYRPVSYQFVQNEEYGRDIEEPVGDDRSLATVLPYYGYMNIVEKVLVEMNDTMASSARSPKTFRMTRYYFRRPRYHTRGRGFLGFIGVWSRLQGQNSVDDIFTYKFNSLDETYNMLVPDSTKTYRFSQPDQNVKTNISKSVFTYMFQNNNHFEGQLGNIPQDVFSPCLTETLTTRNDGSPIYFEKEMFIKDGYGNILTHEHSYGLDGNNYPYYEREVLTYDNSIDADRWIIGNPKTETLTQRLCGVENWKVVRHVSYKNDMNTGRHLEKYSEPGDEKQLRTVYSYDGFGNTVAVTSIGSGITRTESTVFSDDGRFPLAHTNALGQTTTYSYDEATGRIASETDPNGLVTHYHYDIFGNLTQTEFPSGVLEDQTMAWVGSPLQQDHHPDTPDFGAPVYFTYSKRSGEREKYVFYDQHKRKLREVSCNMAGEKTYVDYKYYDVSGLLDSVSTPYFPNDESPQFTNYGFDYLGRNTSIIRPDNGYMSRLYDGSTEIIRGFDGVIMTLRFNPAGQIVMSSTGSNAPVNTVYYLFYGDGKILQSSVNNDLTTAIFYSYDVNRNPLSIIDPSLGELEYDYNAFGELVKSATPRNKTSYAYDAIGRMTWRKDYDGTSTWTYDNGFVGTLSSSIYQPTHNPVVVECFQYDTLGRLARQTQQVGNEEQWIFDYTYNRYGQQNSITYPSGKKVKYHYNGQGFMDNVMDAATGEVLWHANASDRWDNISSFAVGDIVVGYSYDPVTGLVNGIGATRDGQALLNQSYHWSNTGNLVWRTDETLDLKESFSYDGFNRLVAATARDLLETQVLSQQAMSYGSEGNIKQKTGVGVYSYGGNASPYAVTGLQPETGQVGLFVPQAASYTSFDKLKMLEQDGKTLTVDYGIDYQRVKQTFNDGSTTRTKRYFTPLYETVTENGVTKKLHYLTAATGLFAIFAEQTNGASAMHYTLKDHQGNLTATVCGDAVERLSYDAWGRRRNPVGFGYSNVTHTFDRGYTLHEYYDDFDLINMNGRLYDPVLGRMLSPDIAIQDEYNAQAYNRYSYCFNNPLRFTDPSGYVVEDDWYVDKNGRVVWDDNVTNVATTPEGGTYIGPNSKDILKYYGLREQYEKISMTRWGISLGGVNMEYDHNGKLFPNQTPWLIPTILSNRLEGRLTTNVNVNYNTDEASGTNKHGRTFEGITFHFRLSQFALSSVFEGYAGVYCNSKLEESHLKNQHEASVVEAGSQRQYSNAQIFISADNMMTMDSFAEAQIRVGAVNGNFFISPRPVKMKWELTMPTPVATPNRYTFKYYFLYEK